MFIVLAYDIPDNRRRARLFKTLKRFGWAVQESVFEFHLNAGEFAHLKHLIQTIVDPMEDHVRYYQLCPTCHARTEMTPPSIQSADPMAVVV
ncbi:MAG: CRISPR-associated endonuclease Cas2 [Acidobacteriota bacterium]|nr:CRISPR-associated endonuclease Cas2 [Acidobacteriota bacterium]